MTDDRGQMTETRGQIPETDGSERMTEGFECGIRKGECGMVVNQDTRLVLFEYSEFRDPNSAFLSLVYGAQFYSLSWDWEKPHRRIGDRP